MACRLLVSGPLACFRRVEFSIDDVTYDILTPMAARSIFEAVHWTPSIRWNIETIRVLNPIKTCWIAPGQQVDGSPLDAVPAGPSSRRTNALVDVAYELEAHFELTERAGSSESSGQHKAMFKRRLNRQQFFRNPYLGLRAMPARVQQIPCDADVATPKTLKGRVDLGWMLHDIVGGEGRRSRYFRAILQDGMLDLRNPTSIIFAG